MSRIYRITAALAMSALVFGVVGCEEKTEDMTPVEQPTDVADSRLQQLQSMYDAEQQARIAAQEEANQLRGRCSDLEAKLDECQNTPAEGWKNVPGGAMLSIEGVVLFESGKATLKASGKATLDKVASEIQSQFANADIYVFGHTDNEPIRKSGWKDNYELSCQRALAVVRYLQSRGLSNYLAACGWGEHRPVAANTSAATRQQNRRVEFFAKSEQPALSSSR
jgi:chemotaxis protein MotB